MTQPCLHPFASTSTTRGKIEPSSIQDAKAIANLPDATHIAYVPGFGQMACLLATLDVLQVPRDRVAIWCSANQNSPIAASLKALALGFGMQWDLPHRRSRPVVVWTCRGDRTATIALRLLRKIHVDVHISYYDGFRSYLASASQGLNNRLYRGLSGYLRRLTVKPGDQRRVMADLHAFPDDPNLNPFVSPSEKCPWVKVDCETLANAYRTVGQKLEQDGAPPLPKSDQIYAILLTNMLHERCHNVLLDDEINMYRQWIHAVRAELPDAICLIKAHPRGLPVKDALLAKLGEEVNATVMTTGQLLEYHWVTQQTNRFVVFGLPSTALLNLHLLGGRGLALCASWHEVSSHIGERYAFDEFVRYDHEVMKAGKVHIYDNVNNLRAHVAAYRKRDT